jgi:hypothetical protein
MIRHIFNSLSFEIFGKSYISRRLLWQEVSADFAAEKATLRVKQLL